jgi:hypothetical protein
MNQNISENIPASAQFLKITLIDTLTLCSDHGAGSFRSETQVGGDGGRKGGGGMRDKGGVKSKCINQKYFYIVICWETMFYVQLSTYIHV